MDEQQRKPTTREQAIQMGYPRDIPAINPRKERSSYEEKYGQLSDQHGTAILQKCSSLDGIQEQLRKNVDKPQVAVDNLSQKSYQDLHSYENKGPGAYSTLSRPPSEIALMEEHSAAGHQEFHTSIFDVFKPFLPKRKMKSIKPGSREAPRRNLTTKPTILSRARQIIKLEDISEDDIIIAVMGPTGTGKSTFISKATGIDEGIGHNLESCTADIKILKLQLLDHSDSSIVFVDTPGFDSTHKSDADILDMIKDWLKKTYEKKMVLSGILYFHRICDNRMAGTPLKNLRMFEELCGKDNHGIIILTTTMWDEVDLKVGKMREQQLKTDYWSGMIQGGSGTGRFDGTAASAWRILDPLIEKANNRNAELLRKETVDLHRQLRKTSPGQQLFEKMEELLKNRQDTLRRIRDEQKHSQDPNILNILKDECEELRKQMERVVLELQSLKLPVGKRMLRAVFGQRNRRISS